MKPVTAKEGTLTSQGARKAQEWLRTLHDLGWSKDALTSLHDFWLEHHDCDGQIIENASDTSKAAP